MTEISETDTSSISIHSEESTGSTEPSRLHQNLVRGAWVLFSLVCMIFFTIMKLPEDRLKNFVEGNIATVLAQKGISFSAADSSLSVLTGLSYTLKKVTLTFPPPTPEVQIEKIQVSPSILPLILGKMGGTLAIQNGEGKLSASGSVKNNSFSLSFKSAKLDMGKLGILPTLAGFQGSFLFDGSGDLSGDMSVPSTLEGGVELLLSKLIIEAQSVYGFSIPKLSISEAKADIKFEKAKAVIKNLRLGKSGAGGGDDISGTVTGDITLGRKFEMSTLNLNVRFSLSENVMKSFVLLDAILGAGKQADGSYAFQITGPLEAPNAVPVGAGGR